MTERERVEAALGRLKIFPLPRTVLLPRALMPLHVFEPRYRALAADALRSDRVLAIATLRPGWEADYEGRPAVHDAACAGIIIEDQKLPDGRFNLLVLGVQRVCIVGEHAPVEPYRVVRAAAMSDAWPDVPREAMDERADGLRQMVLQLCARRPGPGATALATLAAGAHGPGDLADIVAAALMSESDARMAVLAQSRVEKRLDLVSGHVAGLLGAQPAQPAPVQGKRPLLN